MADDLKQQIQENMKDAMRKKDTLRLSTIRMLMAAIKQREIDEQITLNDADILKIINKMTKQRQDAAEQFSKAGRDELADKEIKEIAILEDYLPEQLSTEAVKTAIQTVIKETGASSMKDMGKVMAALKPTLEGRADMRAVSVIIKDILKG
jgi:uncharacterized protein